MGRLFSFSLSVLACGYNFIVNIAYSQTNIDSTIGGETTINAHSINNVNVYKHGASGFSADVGKIIFDLGVRNDFAYRISNSEKSIDISYIYKENCYFSPEMSVYLANNTDASIMVKEFVLEVQRSVTDNTPFYSCKDIGFSDGLDPGLECALDTAVSNKGVDKIDFAYNICKISDREQCDREPWRYYQSVSTKTEEDYPLFSISLRKEMELLGLKHQYLMSPLVKSFTDWVYYGPAKAPLNVASFLERASYSFHGKNRPRKISRIGARSCPVARSNEINIGASVDDNGRVECSYLSNIPIFHVRGQFKYQVFDHFSGKLKADVLPIESDINPFYIYGYGSAGAEPAMYDMKLKSDGSNYAVSRAVSHSLKPWETEWISLKLGVDHLSYHEFALKVLLTNGKELRSKPIRLLSAPEASDVFNVEHCNAR